MKYQKKAQLSLIKRAIIIAALILVVFLVFVTPIGNLLASVWEMLGIEEEKYNINTLTFIDRDKQEEHRFLEIKSDYSCDKLELGITQETLHVGEKNGEIFYLPLDDIISTKYSFSEEEVTDILNRLEPGKYDITTWCVKKEGLTTTNIPFDSEIVIS